MQNFCKKMEIMQNKRKFRKKYRIFKDKCKILAKKLRKFIKKDWFFLYKTHFQRGTYPQAQLMDEHIIQLQILSFESREFHKFFCAINCCGYKTHGLLKIFAFRQTFCIYCKTFLQYYFGILQSRNFHFSYFRKKYKISWKSLQNVSFAGNPTPKRVDLSCNPRITASLCILQGKQGMYRINQNFIFSLVYWKKEFNPWWVYKPCTMIPVFYLTSCENWTAMKDSSQESSGLTTPHFS